MVEFVQWTPEQMGSLATRSSATRAKQPSGLRSNQGPGFAETAIASFQRENATIDLARRLRKNVRPDGSLEDQDPTWNPHAYMEEAWEKDRLNRLMPFAIEGEFQAAQGPEDVENIAATLEEELKRLELVESGPIAASLLGGFSGAMMDPITYVPFVGLASKGVRLGKVGKYALAGGAGAAAPEAALQNTDRTRSSVESFLNIGGGTLLGGGIGAFARYADPAHPMSPGHAANPLDKDNIGKTPVAIRDPETGELDAVIHPKDSVGAQARIDATPEELPGVFSKVPGINKMIEKYRKGSFRGMTPITRLLRADSPLARRVGLSVVDHGSLLTNLNRWGVRNTERGSADDIKSVVVRRGTQVYHEGERALQKLNKELAAGRKGLSVLSKKGKLSEDEYMEITRKRMRGTWTDDDFEALVDKFGSVENAEKVIAASDNGLRKSLKSFNRDMENLLVDQGLMRDEVAYEQSLDDLSAVRDRIADLRRLKGEEARPDELANLRDQRANIEAEIRDHESRPTSQGEDYVPQMWDAQGISTDHDTAFDFFLGVLVESPSERWLSGVDADVGHSQVLKDRDIALTPNDFKKLGEEEVRGLDVEEGAELKRQVLREWAGDEYTYRLGRAEKKLAAREDTLKQAELTLADVARTTGELGREVARLSLSKARKVRDRVNAQWSKDTAIRDELKAERRSLIEAATAARQKTLARQQQLRAEGRAEPTSAPETAATAQQRGRVLEVSRQLREVDVRVKATEERLERMRLVEDEVRFRQEQVRAARAEAKEALTEANSAKKIAAKDLRSARRELARLRKDTPLDQEVENLVFMLGNRNEVPHMTIDRLGDSSRTHMSKTGRLKQRQLILDPAQVREAEDLGLLRKDMRGLMNAQFSQTAGYYALHKALDMGPGGKFTSWQDVHKQIQADYSERITKATRAGDDKEAARLAQNRDQVLKDLDTSKDRILGHEDVGADRDGWWYWAGESVRKSNFTRFGAGLLPASFTDMGTAALRAGPISRLAKKHFGELVDTLASMQRNELTEFDAMIAGAESGFGGTRLSQIGDMEEELGAFGIGPRNSMQNKITGTSDRGLQWLMDRTPIVGGMRYWNRFWKGLLAINLKYKLRDMTTGYDGLSEAQRANLASLGLGSDEAKRIGQFIDKYGHTDPNSRRWDPKVEDWRETAEGRDAAMGFMTAIDREMDRGIVTPSTGDRPRVTSHIVGKLLLQYQSYGLAFNNKVIGPASQRIANRYEDGVALAAFGNLAFSGAMVVIAKDLLRGEDPEKIKERFTDTDKWAETAVDIADRMGLYAGMTPVVNSALKASTGLQEAAFGETYIGSPSRFARNAWMDDLLGANFGGYRRDVQDFGGAAAGGEWERARDKALLIAPWNFWPRTMRSLHDTMTE